MVGKVTEIRTQSPTPSIKRQLSMKKLGSSYIRKELTTKYSPSHISVLQCTSPILFSINTSKKISGIPRILLPSPCTYYCLKDKSPAAIFRVRSQAARACRSRPACSAQKGLAWSVGNAAWSARSLPRPQGHQPRRTCPPRRS